MGGRRRKGGRRRDHLKRNKATTKRPPEGTIQPRWYEHSFIEVIVAISLSALPTGWTMFGLPQSPVVGVACWAICAALLCHVVWSRTGWRRAYRVSASAIV